MMGKVSEKRSKNMAAIKNKDTKIELILRKLLYKKGYRYRKNYKELPGTPDIALTKYRIAIFCDSEFFHGKNWDDLKVQLEKGNNPDFWINKISRNIQHDREIDKKLSGMGWIVLRFWGKDIKKSPEACLQTIEECIFSQLLDKDEDEQ